MKRMHINKVIQKLNGLIEGFSLVDIVNDKFVLNTPIFTDDGTTIQMQIAANHDGQTIHMTDDTHFIISDGKTVLGHDADLLSDEAIDSITDYIDKFNYQKHGKTKYVDGECTIETDLEHLNKDMLEYSNVLLKLDRFI